MYRLKAKLDGPIQLAGCGGEPASYDPIELALRDLRRKRLQLEFAIRAILQLRPDLRRK